MPPGPAPACSSRILALYPHRRTTGRVALDVWGLVPGSFTSFELRRFEPDLGERLDVIVEESVRKYRPAVVVIAARAPGSSLARRALRAAAALGCRAIVMDIAEVQRSLLAPAPRGFDKVAQVVCAFLPELAERARPEKSTAAIEIRRRRAPAWAAAAAALATLVDAWPFEAAALLRGRLPPGSNIPSLIAAAARRADPTNPL